MSRHIVTKDGDMLDALCWTHYGRADVIPHVLAANPNISQQPAVLPAGLTIFLPDLPAPAEEQIIRLWS